VWIAADFPGAPGRIERKERFWNPGFRPAAGSGASTRVGNDGSLSLTQSCRISGRIPSPVETV
jgi:hypothetical protein